ncbi:alpha/beta fold hydrolase [Sinorhizobium meliloti]|uniref:alpha/beta hydrolase n=1 Tax=Rhizobium meliloti TaxID=382 RepID=UPI00129672D7|nr:alpha/beta hydrolase [Sinorhizobium meliloti]MQX38704.1 alpha/beta fold hydrolase [Sinorhizobium meliloti]
MDNLILDHLGNPATHHRATVNGVRLHYVTAGSGPALLLVHGVPKTSFYWHLIFSLLTEHFTIVAPDVRGFGDSDKPKDGYDMETVATDLAELMTQLGHETFYLHGEDWGAAFAYAVAALNRDRVIKFSFAEKLLPGFGLEDWSHLTEENVKNRHWLWHVSFFHVPDVPEYLIQGKEREFWSTWMKAETYDPHAISETAVNEFVRCCTGPGGLRPIFEVYRQTFKNQAFTKAQSERKLQMPLLVIGAEHFTGDFGQKQACLFAEDVTGELYDCGHSLALERPQKLADSLRAFFIQ